ncbi:MAG TPA: DUF2628 domain-containing protein [Afipia sp.]
MAVYTVHAPANYYGTDVHTTPDRLVFVRDGFYVWAFVAAMIWLVWHRLWLALFGYLAITLAAEIAMWSLGIGSGARLVVMMVIALLIGLEAGSLRRWKLSRRKWRQIDIVVADNEEAAERRFFERWNAKTTQSSERGTMASPPPLPRASLTPSHDVVGLFPEPGAAR